MVLKWENILKIPSNKCGKLPSCVYDYVISDSWFLILKMNGYLVAFFTDFKCLKSKT